MVSEVIRKPSIKQIAENMGRSRNQVAHHVKHGPKLPRGRPLELPCLPRPVFVFVALFLSRRPAWHSQKVVRTSKAVAQSVTGAPPEA
jgi:hypothetical protein